MTTENSSTPQVAEIDATMPLNDLREAIWVAIHSVVDAPAAQITEACAAVMTVLKERGRTP